MKARAFIILMLLVLGWENTSAQNKDSKPSITPRGDEKVSINFSGTSLTEVIKVFEQYTRKRFLFDESVVAGKKIHLLSNKPIPVESIMDVFESVLEVEGLTLLVSGDKKAEIYKIVNAKTVAGKATRTFTARDIENIPENDRVVTLVFQLKYIQAEQIGKAFARMTTVPGGLQPIAGSNLLLITDYASNVKRIGKILEALDDAGPKILRETIKLQNADPIELVREVQPLINIENRVYRAQIQRRMETRMRQLLGRGNRNRNLQGLTSMFADSSSPIAVAAIPRLGSVIISATEEKIGDIKKLITSLDIKDPDEKVIEYYTLHYHRPSTLSRTLSEIFGIAGARRGRRPARAATTKNISIIADDESNKLIVVASRKTHEEVAPVIERLDSYSDYERLLQYYPVKHADVAAVAAIISQVFQLESGDDARIMKWVRRNRRRNIVAEKKGVYSAQDMILVDRNMCSLIIIAPKEVHEKIAEMMKELDVEGPGEKAIQYYRLKFAKADDIATTLSSLFPTARGGRRGRRGGVAQAADRSISVVANTKMETVIVLASRDTHTEVKEIIDNLDAETSILELKYYAVTHGDLDEIAIVLGGLYNLRTGSSAAQIRARRGRSRRGAPEEEPLIFPAAGLNALIVLADRKTHTRITDTLKKLDVEGPGERIVAYYTLRYQKPSTLSRTLSEIFSISGARQRRQRGRGRAQPTTTRNISIVADDESNKVVVVASKEDQKEVEVVIERLDVLADSEHMLRYYPIQHADPDAVGGTLSQVFQLMSADIGRASQWMRLRSRRGGGAQKKGVFAAQDMILVDKNLCSIIVIAHKDVHEKIAEMVKQLDVEGPGEKSIQYYHLEFVRAEEVATTLSSLFQATRPGQRRGRRGAGQTGKDRTISVVPNEKMETVMVLATRDVHREVKEIIANLDVVGSTLELKYYSITHADLAEMASTLGRLYKLEIKTGETQLRSRRGRGRNQRAASGLSEEPVIIPDPNLNALLILAERKTHEGIAETCKKLDVEGPGERVTRLYKIKHTSVTEVASTLTSIFEGAQAGARRRGRGRRPATQQTQTAVVVPNEELSTVVVSASRELHEEIASVVESLDVESVKDNVLRYYPIKNSELEPVADTISKVFNLTKGDDRRLLMNRRRPSRRGSTDQRSPYSRENVVIVDHNLGSLVIVAPVEMHEKIMPVLEKIDSVGPGKREVKYYRVARSSILEMAATIASVFDLDMASSRRRTRTRNPNLPLRTSVVIPNESLGCIIVVAPADVQKRIDAMIKSMDRAGPDENELKYYKIEKSDIIEAANIISQVFGITVGTVEQTFRQRGRRQTADLLTKERVVIPNENLNTLMIVAPREMQVEIASTIERIDATGPRDYLFKMYEVTVSEVTTAAQTVSRLFDIPIIDNRLRATRSRRGPATGPKISADPFILPDEELGSLIVNAPEEIHVEVKKVLDKLVSIGKQEKMSIRFYKLKNTDAEEVAGKIGSLFNVSVGTPGTVRRTTRRTSRGGVASRRGRTSTEEEEEKPAIQEAPTPFVATQKKSKKDFYFEGESVVIPDKNLNSVILIAPDYIHAEVKAILDTLDVRRPQVLFEVAILDISSDSKLDIGTEISSWEEKSGTQGRGFTNFGLGDRETPLTGGFPNKTTVPTDIAGLFVGVTKGDVANIPLLIRLLKENTDVNIRSTPLLLVNDNEDATFSSLSEQPTTSTSQGTATTNVSFGGFVEAGTTLKITPHVSEGNYIRVDIDLKVENFYGDAPGPGIPPPKASNQLITSITVPDSRTVVIGGLTTRKKTEVKKGIPILCDIPLLGYLFSSSSDQEETSRLFLFIRPQILDDVDFKDLNRISADKSLEVQGITGENIVPDKKAAGVKEDM